MRLMVVPKKHTVLVWAISGRGYRLYAPTLVGRKVFFRKRLDFKSLDDTRINEDAKDHWRRLEQFEQPANISPGELAKFLAEMLCGSPDDSTEYVGETAYPRVSGLRANGFDISFDFTW